MELLDQHTKKIMEDCKDRARSAGLQFDDNSLEYIVTNQDMIELSPKVMVPGMYDFWLDDVQMLREKGSYELQPHNAYETVINTRPAISFYNDNNPDWLNVMIFYHVLGHIDFFQNNVYFSHTWNDDYNGQALAGKRCIERLRSEHGRWVEYVIECARAVDNLCSYYKTLNKKHDNRNELERKTDFFFDVFVQNVENFSEPEFMVLLDEFNATQPNIFFVEILKKYPEFNASFKKYEEKVNSDGDDIIEYIMNNSPFLN